MPHGQAFRNREVVLFSGAAVEARTGTGLARNAPLTGKLPAPLPSDEWITVRVSCQGDAFVVHLGRDSAAAVLAGKTQAEAGTVCLVVEECEAVFRDLRIERIGTYGEDAPAAVGPIDPSALFYWRFDEGRGSVLTDSAGKGSVGRINDKNIPRWIDGKMGNALEWLDPVADSGITFPVTLDCPLVQTDGVTVELWVLLREYPRKPVLLLGRVGYDLTLSPTGGLRARVTLSHPKGWNHSWPGVGSRKPIPLNEWTHIAMSYAKETREIRLYVNGELAGANKNLEGFTDYHLHKGPDWMMTVLGPGFVGAIDELRISAMPREDLLRPAK